MAARTNWWSNAWKRIRTTYWGRGIWRRFKPSHLNNLVSTIPLRTKIERDDHGRVIADQTLILKVPFLHDSAPAPARVSLPMPSTANS